jgi:predicted glycosyltransferase involved in capsule biosynthesis
MSLPNKITLVLHCYGNQSAIDSQLLKFSAMKSSVSSRINFVIIDDCSSPSLSLTWSHHLNVSHLIITDDIPWNMAGCKNLGASIATTEYLLFTDVDYYFSETSLSLLVENISFLDAKKLYLFNARYMGKQISPHPNSFLVNRFEYLQVGGMDEDFCGAYGYEDIEFLARWERFGHQKTLIPDITLDNWGEKTEGLDRDSSRNYKLLQEKLTNPISPRGICRFRWRGK